jgi:hypothetical protein
MSQNINPFHAANELTRSSISEHYIKFKKDKPVHKNDDFLFWIKF